MGLISKVDATTGDGLQSVPDLPLCLRVFKHRNPLAGGPSFCQKNFFTMDFCLCGAIL